MKKTLFFILVASFFTLGLTIGNKRTEALIPEKEMDTSIENFTDQGIPLIQHGGWE